MGVGLGRWLGVLLAFGCTPQGALPPVSHVSQFAQAVEKADAERVHALLDAKSQRLVTVDGVRRMLEDGGEELRAWARAASGTDVDISVTSIHPVTTLELVKNDDGFSLVSDGFALRGGSSPVVTLSQLRNALEDRNEVALMLLLSRESLGRLERKLDGLASALQNVVANEVEVSVDRATVRLEAGHRVELRREGGVWKVQDFE